MTPKKASKNRKKKSKKAPADLFEIALSRRDSGDREEAESILSTLVNDYPDDLNVRIVYGGLLFNLERFDEAVIHFQWVLERRPKAEPASLGLFHSLWEIGRHEEAVKEIRRFFSEGGESMEYRRLLKDISKRE